MHINCTEIYGKNVLEMYVTQEYRSAGVHISQVSTWVSKFCIIFLGS